MAESAGAIEFILQLKTNLAQQINAAVDKAKSGAKLSGEKLGGDIAQGIEKGYNARIEKQQVKLKSLNRQLDDNVAKLDAIRQRYKVISTINPYKTAENDSEYKKLLKQNENLVEKIRVGEENLAISKKVVEEKKVARAKKRAEKEEEIRKKAREKIAREEEKTMQKAKAVREKSSPLVKTGSRIKKMFSALGRSIKRAFKAVFIMTVIYAAFRKLRDIIGQTAKKSKTFSDNLNKVKANLRAAFTPIVTAVMPLLEKLMAALAKITTFITTFIAGLFGKTYKQVMRRTKKLGGGKGGAKKGGSLAGFDEINQLQASDGGRRGGIDFDRIDEKGSGVAAKLSEKFRKVFRDIKEFLSPVNEALIKMWDNAKTAFKAFADVVSPGIIALWDNLLLPFITWVRDAFTRSIDWLSEKFSDFARWIGERSDVIIAALTNIGKIFGFIWEKFIQPILKTIVKSVGEILDWLFVALGGLTDFLLGVFTGNWKRAVYGLKNIFVGMVNSVISAAEGLANAFIDVLNGVISAVKKSKIGDYLTTKLNIDNVSHINLKKIPMATFATGGVITQPTLGLMGEYAGSGSNPEIVAPQSLMLDTFMQAIEPLIAMIKQLIETTSAGQEVHIHLDGSLSAFARTIKPYLDDEAKRKGVKIVMEA